MRHRRPLIPVSLRTLRLSAAMKTWISLPERTTMRAREVADGFEITLRCAEPKRVITSKISFEPAVGSVHAQLVCGKCHNKCGRHLYLAAIDARPVWVCFKCTGLKYKQADIQQAGDFQERLKFRRLLRRKLDADILNFELGVMRTTPAEEYFRSRPYLVPWFADYARDLRPDLYRKILKILMGKFRSVMRRKVARSLLPKERVWLMERLQHRIERCTIITREEERWLIQHTNDRRKGGRPSGTSSGESRLPPAETGSSSSRTSFAADTIAIPAEDSGS